jgi:hypothetical protein
MATLSLGSATSADVGSGVRVGRTVGLGRGDVRGLTTGPGVRVGEVVGATGAGVRMDADGEAMGEDGRTGVGAATEDGTHAATDATTKSHATRRGAGLDDGMPSSSHPLGPMRDEQMGYADRSVD